MAITGYFGIENLNLTNAQRDTLVDGLKQLGENNSANKPNEKNHWGVRQDNQAVIFEGLFNPDTLTIAAIKQRLANIFNVAVGTISHTTNQSQYGLIITFIHSGQQKMRSIAFGNVGGTWGTWDVSNEEARAYLTANAVAWGNVP